MTRGLALGCGWVTVSRSSCWSVTIESGWHLLVASKVDQRGDEGDPFLVVEPGKPPHYVLGAAFAMLDDASGGDPGHHPISRGRVGDDPKAAVTPRTTPTAYQAMCRAS